MIDHCILLPGLRFERRRRDASVVMTANHFHNHYEFYYLWEGERQYFINTEVFSVRAGAVVWINPGNIHCTSGASNTPHERTLLEIDDMWFQKLQNRSLENALSSLHQSPASIYQLENTDRRNMEWLLEDLFLEAESKKTAYREYICIRLEEILLHLVRKHSESAITAIQSEKHLKVHEIAKYITAFYAEIQSLDQLCKKFYISKSHLCHIFKEVTGMTVQEYITATRMNYAQKLLAQTKRSVTDIAYRIGYSSITHFERMFKRLTGKTPLQYRIECQQK